MIVYLSQVLCCRRIGIKQKGHLAVPHVPYFTDDQSNDRTASSSFLLARKYN